MYGSVWSAAVYGVEGRLIQMEIDISSGLPHVQVVGLPDAAVRESVDRVRSAVRNCGWKFPLERITINLAPADLRKEGTSYDLAMAIGLLGTSDQLPLSPFNSVLIAGELALDGSTRPIPGILSLVDEAKRHGITQVLVPADNANEASLVQGVTVYSLSNLAQLRECENTPNGLTSLLFTPSTPPLSQSNTESIVIQDGQEDYSEVRGQVHVKRALTVAAAAMHNVLLSGPPGTGKTMLIRRLPTILPTLTDEEALEVSKLYSVSGKWDQASEGLIRTRPFRAPHHSISAAGLIGGGSIPKPGEISLAHRGVLFLDELPEFPRQALEVLRQPLEDRYVTISRARAIYRFPAHFMLAVSMNPCPCGFDGADHSVCTCTAVRRQNYRSRLSGPLLDRIDMQIEVPRAPLNGERNAAGSSAMMREQVLEAHARQMSRYRHLPIRFNSELKGTWLQRFCALSTDASDMLQQVYDKLGLSIRAHDRLLKLARTIADLDGCEQIGFTHLAEAISYRSLDRKKE